MNRALRRSLRRTEHIVASLDARMDALIGVWPLEDSAPRPDRPSEWGLGVDGRWWWLRADGEFASSSSTPAPAPTDPPVTVSEVTVAPDYAKYGPNLERFDPRKQTRWGY